MVPGRWHRPRQLPLLLLPPRRQPVKQPERVLRGLVLRHLVLVLASLLGEGADALVDPLVAVDLDAPLGQSGGAAGDGGRRAGRGGGGHGGDGAGAGLVGRARGYDAVDAGLVRGRPPQGAEVVSCEL